MAQGDVHALSLGGTYLGVPVAVGMAYQQEETDPVAVSAGQDLINSWFLNETGPWSLIRAKCSNQLNWDCATSAWGEQVHTTFLSGGNGLSALPSLPSTHCCQVNVPPLKPHPDGYEGRFYWPGFLREDTLRSGWTFAMNAILVVWETALLSLEGHSSAASGAWRIVPHPKYLDVALGTTDVWGWLPYHHPWVKVLGNRKADNCAAFTGGGDGDFGPVVIPPPVP